MKLRKDREFSFKSKAGNKLPIKKLYLWDGTAEICVNKLLAKHCQKNIN